MSQSLYSLLGTAVIRPADQAGTRRTAARETIDDDTLQMADLFASMGTLVTKQEETLDNDVDVSYFHQPTGVGPRPGTRFTEAVETIDNDSVAQLDQLVAPHDKEPRPRPAPGTTVTFTEETTDESDAAIGGLL
jgi:hypothetical protein